MPDTSGAKDNTSSRQRVAAEEQRQAVPRALRQLPSHDFVLLSDRHGSARGAPLRQGNSDWSTTLISH